MTYTPDNTQVIEVSDIIKCPCHSFPDLGGGSMQLCFHLKGTGHCRRWPGGDRPPAHCPLWEYPLKFTVTVKEEG